MSRRSPATGRGGRRQSGRGSSSSLGGRDDVAERRWRARRCPGGVGLRAGMQGGPTGVVEEGWPLALDEQARRFPETLADDLMLPWVHPTKPPPERTAGFVRREHLEGSGV